MMMIFESITPAGWTFVGFFYSGVFALSRFWNPVDYLLSKIRKWKHFIDQKKKEEFDKYLTRKTIRLIILTVFFYGMTELSLYWDNYTEQANWLFANVILIEDLATIFLLLYIFYFELTSWCYVMYRSFTINRIKKCCQQSLKHEDLTFCVQCGKELKREHKDEKISKELELKEEITND